MGVERISGQANFTQWYADVVQAAGLAEHSAVRGCMIIKPHGYALWERMQRLLDDRLKESGHANAYFPLFIPQSHLSREAAHVEGFAKECAVVTHYRLRATEGKIEIDPQAQLEEPLIVRPTSETVIWNSYKKWIQSYRDLPVLLNQWSNVVRWEMRPRLLLRTAEFLWQEGHTAHATAEEAQAETLRILDIYTDFVEQEMALPVVQGRKSEGERFSGAEETYCIEALMRDGKALQAGTSHYLGQNFARAFGVQYADAKGALQHVWGTSWGVSTRLMGALVMAHGDDKGLRLPPSIAPEQIVIIPIYKQNDNAQPIRQYAKNIHAQLKSAGLRAHLDERTYYTPGWKFAQYELKGIPLRIAIGPKEVEEGTLSCKRRDNGENLTLQANERLPQAIRQCLKDIQKGLYEDALSFQQKHTHTAHSYSELQKLLEKGGWVWAAWDGTPETEALIQQETRATIRCIPLKPSEASTKEACIRTGKTPALRALFARAY